MIASRMEYRSGWRKPLLGLSLLVVLSGCAFAPGSHMGYDTQGENLSDNIEIKPITPSLVKTLAATEDDLRDSLFEYSENAVPESDLDYDYLIGRGDILSVVVYDHPELTIPAGSERSAEESGNVVHSDGTIFYPYIGTVDVAGRTVRDVRSEIQRRLEGYIAQPQVDVKVAAFNAQKAYVTGQVEQAGAQPITNIPLRVLDALSSVGGLTQGGDWHNVVLTRNGEEIHLSVYDMLVNGHMGQNLLLQDGDVLHVPVVGNQQVYVMGEVNTPTAVPMPNTRFSLTNALSQAGGINENSADASGIFVIRRNHDVDSDIFATVYQLNAKNAISFALGAEFILQPTDVVYVTAAPIARWNRVISQILPSVTAIYQITQATRDIQDIDDNL
ncbi:polysaccharide export outer membrane protein [Chromohalobacter marismortui]|uniref:Polysaccharide export outer membrane protein n=1 Tax=Chromohalobacter marismortui TaxID=42055 RepID=A0A4R7NWK0_9GAMM|nr:MULTISPECIES: polysaccharide export protein [Chromohalobacter]MCI0511144.1 polysaccharide biosynthesis/export family protein [Chromohalobacter sp.]MCI0594560.1 polysaccharide biosynthesis/export family protein [Chromohalobacter sp.]TDU25169.1 polysaccharide export outer membrane protein [Chromohalobacter marismortui]